MSRLLRADAVRMYRGKWFWLCLGGMLLMSLGFIGMQYTAMDYSVPLSRVIFLPLSFYGVAVAALVSMYVGEDFSDGFIRNKIIAGRSRYSIFLSNLMIGWTACVIIYVIITLFTFLVGRGLFEIDVTWGEYGCYLLWGVFMCLAYGSIFGTVTMLTGNKAVAVMLCMGLAFGLLLLCLHTNQIIVQPEYKDGVLNPHYVSGVKKIVYGILHDVNPSGQAAQLSTMDILNPIRWIACDIGWMLVAAGVGTALFQRANIR